MTSGVPLFDRVQISSVAAIALSGTVKRQTSCKRAKLSPSICDSGAYLLLLASAA